MRSKSKGKLVIISGPSGCGKTTVCERLTQGTNTIKRSVSATTRPPRPDEKDGVHYHFLSREEFYKRIDAGKFIEYAEYNGNLYGTGLDPLIDALEGGFVYILEIDVHGASQIRSKFPEAITIFLLPPDDTTLKERLINRNTDKGPELNERLAIAKNEYRYKDEFTFCIINDELDETINEIKKVLELK